MIHNRTLCEGSHFFFYYILFINKKNFRFWNGSRHVILRYDFILEACHSRRVYRIYENMDHDHDNFCYFCTRLSQ